MEEALTAQGASRVRQNVDGSTWTKPGDPYVFVYLGKGGACRVGPTKVGSYVAAGFKGKLLEQVPA
jgi:hypothetical protein